MVRSKDFANQALRIRLSLSGCTNRPFYHIVVAKAYRARDTKPLDQIGTYDPMPNENNEKLVAINFEKLHQWINKGALPTKPISILLGLAGFFPLHPMTQITAMRNNKKEQERQKASETESSNDELESAV